MVSIDHNLPDLYKYHKVKMYINGIVHLRKHAKGCGHYETLYVSSLERSMTLTSLVQHNTLQ